MLELKDRKVVVLGLGDTGLSMTRWLARRGADIRVADTRGNPPGAAALERELPHIPFVSGPFTDALFRDCDLIALSPGIDRREPVLARALAAGKPVAGDVELFAQAVSKTGTRVVGITGTNGKSTVTAMAGEICRAAELRTVVAGNIGLPVLDALSAVEDGVGEPDVYVLELSSFQLESTASLRPDAATVLNITEDHLDRYDGIEEYAAAKARIFAGSGAQVLNRDDPRSLAMVAPGRHVATFGVSVPAGRDEWGLSARDGGADLMRGPEKLLALRELPVAGIHNALNALAAGALADAIGIESRAIVDGLRRFEGLPHRVQKIRSIGGVVFYDDSKGTNVGATVAALTGMTQPVVLIAGGDGKGQDFAPLADAVSRHARAVVLIGRDADVIARILAGGKVPMVHATDMHDAVRAALGAAKDGDAVLLSPACASYDMFRNYVHRAEVFAAAVTQLAEARA